MCKAHLTCIQVAYSSAWEAQMIWSTCPGNNSLHCWQSKIANVQIRCAWNYHNLSKAQHDDVGRLAAGDSIEKLKKYRYVKEFIIRTGTIGAAAEKFCTLVSVISKPRIEVTIMIPINQNEMCWDQNATCRKKRRFSEVMCYTQVEILLVSQTSNWMPNHVTAISKPRVIGSFLPTLSKTMLIVAWNVMQSHQTILQTTISTGKYNFWCRTSSSYHEDLPAAIDGEEVAKNVEVATFECFEFLASRLLVMEVDTLEEELSTQLLVSWTVLTQRRQVLLQSQQNDTSSKTVQLIVCIQLRTNVAVCCRETTHHIPNTTTLAFHRLTLTSFSLHHRNSESTWRKTVHSNLEKWKVAICWLNTASSSWQSCPWSA